MNAKMIGNFLFRFMKFLKFRSNEDNVVYYTSLFYGISDTLFASVYLG
ncbi:MAG: hypothetical protein BAJALOKI2v1_910006 [Promethearchaeota archaeon]|nr:MAG: hypothetical protein BAJALOKI2v1_910006 [Candidatus Lokiarchaeota archaeon]